MNKEGKLKRIKSILAIDTSIKSGRNLFQSSNQYQDTLQVKPLRSTRNQFQMREMFFRSSKHQEAITRKYSLTLSELQKEKEQLIQSIHILKTGAISAIAEKVDNFQRLKEIATSINEEQRALYQQVINNSKITEKELQVSLKQLHDQMQQERRSLADILDQKETRIQQLEDLVGTLRSYIEELQSNQRKIIQKMKELQSKIYYLSKQIEHYKLPYVLEKFNHKNEYLGEKSQYIHSSIKCSKSTSNLLEALHTNDYSTSVENQFAQKIYQIKQSHTQEVQEMKEIYEKKIANIRNVYNFYFDEEAQEQDLRSRIKNKKTFSYVDELEENKTLNRTHSSAHRINFTDQEAYNIEKVSEPSVHILKQEIKFVHQAFTSSNQNSCQGSSQFTKEHFQNPSVFIKQKSTASIKSVKNTKNVMASVDADKSKDSHHSDQEILEKNNKVKRQNRRMFVAGFISGIAITCVMNVIKKKKYFKSLLKYFLL